MSGKCQVKLYLMAWVLSSVIMCPAQVLNQLASFNGADGDGPAAPVIQATDGNFYGTTTCGGTNQGGCGTVYKVTPSGTLTSLHTFCSQPHCADGDLPAAPLVQASDGNFYGTTSAGGNYAGSCTIGCGTVFRITPNGTLTTLHTFNGADGANPYAGLTQGRDGYLYGTTNGLQVDQGTFFRISLSGQFSSLGTLYSGSQLVQGSDGNFYGTTADGGSSSSDCQPDGCGTVFKITPSGTLTTLYEFCTQSNCPDGWLPQAGLVLAGDGSFYGTTSIGGRGAYQGQRRAGTIFKITPTGAFTTLYSFCSQPNCTDGGYSAGVLMQASDGNLYGTTQEGGTGKGTDGAGTIFRITTGGSFTSLYSFCLEACFLDGAGPEAGLIQAVDGMLYGTTFGGGYSLGGTVFSFQPNNSLLTVSTTGDGVVTSTDGYIDCPGVCTHIYADNTPITLNASPGQGSGFAGWSGGCTGTGTCNLVIRQNETVAATFATLYMLTVVADGSGSIVSADGYINCPGACSHAYLANTAVTLNAHPAPGWSLSNWSGACSGTGPCQITITQDQSVTGTFVQDSFALTVAVNGSGTVTSTDGYINCPGSCSHTYLSLTQVTLNAAPSQDWVFGGWDGACTGTGACTLTMTAPFSVGGVFSHALQFVATAPCRLVDTRNPTGTFGGPPLQAGVARSFPLPQQTPCDIPPTAEAYSLNVTLVPIGGHSVGLLTVWPTDENQPNVSIMNSWDGRFKANAAIIPAGTNGAVSVYSSDTTNVVLEIDGYFVPTNSSTLAFYPLPPCRVADTRNPDGALGGPYLSTNTERDFPVLDASACNIPNTAQAYSLNFTVIPRSDQVWVFTAWPFGQNQPGTSTLNAPTGTVVANAAILPAGTNGEIATSASADTDVAIDINGYFAPAAAGGLSLYPVAPCRVLDTRKVGNGAPFTGTLQPPADPVTSVCGLPSTSEAYVFNATIVPAGNPVYVLTLWPDGGQFPNVSTLNAYDGAVTSNMAIVPTTNGSLDADAAGLTQLILDISGYFAQ